MCYEGVKCWLTSAYEKLKVVSADLFNGHASLDVTLVGQVGRIGDDEVEILLKLGVDGEWALVVVEQKVVAVHVEATIVLEQFDVDIVHLRGEVGQIRMRL